jgi:hypothetical protein
MPKLHIERVDALVDWLRAYKILLDGEVVGQIRNGREVVLEVPPGRHELSLKIDWAGSNTLTFDAAEGPLYFDCGCRLRGKDILLRGPAYLLAPSGDYLWLRQRDNAEDRPS